MRFVPFVLLLALLWPSFAAAQLEVLLRGLDPAPPRAGAWGRYRFTAEEPSGPRSLVFEARIERVEPGPSGSVVLRLTSGDSLHAQVTVGKEFFAGRGAASLAAVRSVIEVTRGDTTRVARSDWSSLPGFDPAPPLPGARDSLLGERTLEVGGQSLRAHGRRITEQSRQVRDLGEVTMTQVLDREIESWSAPWAPLLGLVRVEAKIWSQKDFSHPVPGVPSAGKRSWHYTIELIRSERPSGTAP